MKSTLLLFAICISGLLSAQQTETFYFGADYKEVSTKASAAYIANVYSEYKKKERISYHYEIYNVSGKLIYYKASESFLLQETDSIALYYPQGIIRTIYYYDNNKSLSQKNEYDRNGNLTSVTNYTNGKPEILEEYKNAGSSEKVFSIVEVMPQFPGGEKEMYAFLGKNLRYPKYAKEHEIEGKIYINFIVRKDGSMDNMWIKEGTHPILDFAAMRTISKMPLWEPGMQQGVKVDLSYNLPVFFKLQK